MRVLSVASEVYPFVKTGGLADVISALPRALAAEDVRVSTLVPGYPAVLAARPDVKSVATFKDFFGDDARVLAGRAAGLDLFVLDAPHLYGREGNPYTAPSGADWKDNAQRFAALSRAGAELGRGIVKGFVPDVVHAHDWQTGLVPAYLQVTGGSRPATVFTVHNLAFQGKFDRALLGVLGLPYDAYEVEGVEYYGTIGYLKAGIQYADRITTVSPTYAAEILTDEGGMGLEGLLRKRAHVLSGILNGIDTDVWNPATDPNIAATYEADTLEARATNTASLQKRLGLDVDPAALVLGVISRLSWQKGLDVLLEALPEIAGDGAQLALLGAGEADMERGFAEAAAASPTRIACTFGYDEALAHQIQAGAVALIVPSRFEPCGLTQLCALRYGAVPIVARVGGLADTVIDANEMALAAGVATGFMFWPMQKETLQAAVTRAAAAFHESRTWSQLRKNGMRTDVSWQRPARHYARLYRDLLASRA